MLEKEKLLVTSDFSFSHDVFHSYIYLVCQNVALCGNGLILKYRRVQLVHLKRSTNTSKHILVNPFPNDKF